MPGISQRTLAKVIVVLSEMLPRDADTFPLMRDFWRTKLFEWGFPDWLTNHFISRGMNWSIWVGAVDVLFPTMAGGTLDAGKAICTVD